ncbi:MAG: serine hydrolase domain-containing protein [Nakamurella sp.]
MSDLQERVQDLIDTLVQSGTEDGLQVAIYRHGEQLVDAVAGATSFINTDQQTGRPVAADTLFWSASTGKAVTSTLLHVLVEQGALDYDTPIARWWPEFAARGKGSATLRHLLTHAAGVPAIPADTTIEQLSDWRHMCAVIADTEPWWVPGEKVGYHAVTFGFIAGEIVRRATGQPLGQVLAEQLTGPLGIAGELYFAVPGSELGRIARQQDDPVGSAVFATLPADWPLFRTAPRALFPNASYANRVDLLTADIPYSATGSARAFARMYAALLGAVDGVRLVGPDRLQHISALSTTGDDVMTGGPSTWALGYSAGLPWQAAAQDNPNVFGMVGVGGSAAFANRATGVSIAVTKNRFNPVSINAVERVHELVSKEF